MQSLKKRLGYFPHNLELYKLALKHGSVLNNNTALNNNERLEFLGDAVIELIVSNFLYNHFDNQREGFLTQMRSRLVNREHLAKLAVHLDLQPLISTRRVRITKNIMSNTLEALVGAMYLDVGYKKTTLYFIKNILTPFIDIDKLQYQTTDFKSRLLEITQRHAGWRADFDTKEQREIHQKYPVFHCTLRINDKIQGSGSGKSKKEAEQNAAKKALDTLEPPTNE